MKRCIDLFLIILITLVVVGVAVFLVRYYFFVPPKNITLNEFILAVTALAALLYGYETYKFQKVTNEFNRLTKIPALNVKKCSLENNNVIHIENQTDYPAKNVYIGSFLFTKNGESHEILYDEIQLQITKSYPIIQSDILKENFRGEFEDDDEKNYKSTLRERIKNFISQNTNVYLIIALRSQFMNDDETLLFFYECNCSDQNLPTLSFTSRHFSIKEQLFEKSLKKITKRYNEYKKNIKKFNMGFRRTR